MTVPADPPAALRDRSRLRGDWHAVATRSYGTRIYRVHNRHTYYVKTTPHVGASSVPPDRDHRFDPAAEAERLVWLRGNGFPVPEVVEVGTDERLAWLVTTGLPGVEPMTAGWTPDQRLSIVDTVATLVRELHALPVAGCPFDMSLRVTLPWAHRAATEGLVDLDDLDPEHAGWSERQLLAKLQATAIPPEDLVVCHGDLCLDNVLVDPDTLALTGVLDVGRLGVADRWRDLAILLRTFREPGWDDATHTGRALRRYGTSVDDERLRFYLLLDEFF